MSSENKLTYEEAKKFDGDAKEFLRKSREFSQEDEDLKTLKDLKDNIAGISPHCEEAVKALAIKWIKELSKFEYMEKDGFCLTCGEWKDSMCDSSHLFLDYFCESSDVAGAIKILKHIHNISEEYLE